MGHLLYWFFGLSGTGSYYAFWSGLGSDISEVAILGGVYAAYRKHNCHVKGCWRIGKHHVDGTPYTVCRIHHPEIPNRAPTHEEIRRAHRVAQI